jgi:hypothetical protein
MSNPTHTPAALLRRLGVAAAANTGGGEGTTASKMGGRASIVNRVSQKNRVSQQSAAGKLTTCLKPHAIGVAIIPLTLLALLFTTPALADKGYLETGSFGSEGTGNGQFMGPAGVAVDDSTSTNPEVLPYEGDLYVADTSDSRVERFSSVGVYEAQFDGEATPSKLRFEGIVAVDDSDGPAAGEVYVPARVPEPPFVESPWVVAEFTAEGKYVGELTEREECAAVGGVEQCGGTGTKVPFGGIDGVAVDPSGDLWVLESARLVEFSDEGVFMRSVSLILPESSGAEESSGLAIDSLGDVYVATKSRGGKVARIVKFSPEGKRLVEFGEGTIAVDARLAIDTVTDDVFVEGGVGNELDEFGPFGEPYSAPVEVLPPGGLPEEAHGLAVSSAGSTLGTGTVYASQRLANRVAVLQFVERPDVVTGVVSEQGSESPVVSGTVNPAGVPLESCEFEYGTSTSYGASAPCEQSPAQIYAASGIEHDLAVPVSVRLTGLLKDTLYHYRLKASNGTVAPHGVEYGQDGTFGPPQLGEQAAVGGVNGATLTAQLDPEQSSTSYYVEYASAAEEGCLASGTCRKTSVQSAGGGSSAVGLSEALGGLLAQTSYRFRFVASNSSGVSYGSVVGFSTFAAPPVGLLGLPDGRGYEMVSPPGAVDAEAYVPKVQLGPEFSHATEGLFEPFQAAGDGDGVAYAGSPAGPDGSGGAEGSGEGNEFLARRCAGAAGCPSNGWESSDVQPSGPPRDVAYRAFSGGLSVGFLSSSDSSPLSSSVPEGGYEVLYSRLAGAEGYAPLFSLAPPHRPGGIGTEPGAFHPVFAGASESSGAAIFAANDALIPGTGKLETELGDIAEEEFKHGEDGDFLYVSVGGRLSLVDLLPGAVPRVAAKATFGAPNLPQGLYTEGSPPDFSHVISGDGSRVFWTDSAGEVFVREHPTQPQSTVSSGKCVTPADACTVQLSEGPARYWTATPAGEYAFYVENDKLYRFNFAKLEALEKSSKSEAKDLEAAREVLAGEGVGVAHESAGVEGVIGSSEDGETVYFVANGVLTANANSQGASAVAGQPNLYREDAGVTTLVATLAAGDNANKWYNPVTSPDGEVYGDWEPGLGTRTAEVTPDGGAVVFMSTASLKTVNFPQGYDNAGCPSGETNNLKVGCTEVYLYDAEGAGGSLFCTSCAPGGAPPSVTAGDAFELTSFVPIEWGALYQPRWVSNSGGRVFFDSLEPLVGRDQNGTLDVYEWERNGEGSCGQADGCVYLISGGTGSQTNASYLLDASESGEDVFFATRSQLLAQDTNEGMDVYDARVGAVQPPQPNQCQGTACQGAPPAPPTFATPSSVTFNGTGNFPGGRESNRSVAKPKPLTKTQKLAAALKACKKDRSKVKRASCEKQARAKDGPTKKKAKKSTYTNRRAPR